MSLNKVCESLAPYPMEELAKIKRELLENDQPVFDFGTGDPRIPVWEQINHSMREAIPGTYQYPRIAGSDELETAHLGYLSRRFSISDEVAVLPSRGSKEAVFHLAQCIVGRAGGKKYVIYPDPGYPVYKTSTLFAGGVPYPVTLDPSNSYLLEPWNLPKHVQNDAAALWINYPHNPTGTCVDRGYLEKIVAWSRESNTLLLSDDCYIDLYNPESESIPPNPLEFGSKGVLSLMSLSKRSGMTGLRAGMIAGDPELIAQLKRARANMGLAQPNFIQSAAATAWDDDSHVEERRSIFRSRLELLGEKLKEWGMIDSIPEGTFYLWARVPERFKGNDVKFAKALAEKGVIVSPAQWLSESSKGFVRFALVPDEKEIEAAIPLIESLCSGESQE